MKREVLILVIVAGRYCTFDAKISYSLTQKILASTYAMLPAILDHSKGRGMNHAETAPNRTPLVTQFEYLSPILGT